MSSNRPGIRFCRRAARVAALLLLTVAGCLTGEPGAQVAPEPETLPIFRLAPASASPDRVRELAAGLFGVKGDVERRDQRLRLTADGRQVEVCTRSGGVWAADTTRQWRPEKAGPLPVEKDALARAEDVAQRVALLPRLTGQPVKLGAPFAVRTWMSQLALNPDGTTKRTDTPLDWTVRWQIEIAIQDLLSGKPVPPEPGPPYLPIVGGGGDFSVSIGADGQVVGCSGTWRDIVDTAWRVPVIPRAQSDERFREATRAMDVTAFESKLAYYAAPSGLGQEYLYPVRVYRGTARIGGHDVPLREMLLPACADFPLAHADLRPARPRGRDASPRPTSTDYLRDLPEGWSKVGSLFDMAKLAPELLKPWLGLYSEREFGTSFIGTLGGLGGSFNNAGGFVDELTADGWLKNFQWGDADAWESDWNANDDSWLDAADFVFYTGHASGDGWMLAAPDDGWLDRSEVGGTSPVDHWGQDLEWVIVAACGPLQDDLVNGPGNGDVFEHWSGAFDGLHQLLGYATVTGDNEEEGKRVVRYVRDGANLIDAWFRTGREIQWADVWVGVLYPYRSGQPSVRDDSVWGYGPVAPDAFPADGYVAIWTQV